MPLITFEGIEGCGKSTQARRAAEHLRGRGVDVLLEREPGGTPAGARLREILLSRADQGIDALAELLLVEADRRIHVARVIAPALEAGTTVLCDRFSDSTLAYQAGGRGLSPAFVEALDQEVVGAVRPALTLLFDCPVEIGLARAAARDGRNSSRFESEPVEFHRRVRQAYLDIARRETARVRVIDARRPAEEVFEEVAGLLDGAAR